MKESWSPKELKKLLHGLRMHGEKEVEQIAAEIQTKSVDMVQEYIGFLKERKHRTVKQRNSRVDKTPLEDWLRIIRQHMGGDCDYSHVITNVVEIISRFEPCDRFAWGKGTKPNYRRIYAFLARVLRARDDRLALYFKQNGHWTAQGHRAIAELIAPHVVEAVSAEPALEADPD